MDRTLSSIPIVNSHIISSLQNSVIQQGLLKRLKQFKYMKNKIFLMLSLTAMIFASSCSKDDTSSVSIGEGQSLRYTLYTTFEVDPTNTLGTRALDTAVVVNDIESRLKALDSRLDLSMINNIHIIGARLNFKNPTTSHFNFLENVEALVQVGSGAPLRVTYLDNIPNTNLKLLKLNYDAKNNYAAYFNQSNFRYILKGKIDSPLTTKAVITANISFLVELK